MAWVERLVTRVSQPQDACAIDWSNPLTKGLVFSSANELLQESGTVFRPTPSGKSRLYSGGQLSSRMYNLPLLTGVPATLFAVGYVTTTASTNTLLSIGDPVNTGKYYQLGFNSGGTVRAVDRQDAYVGANTTESATTNSVVSIAGVFKSTTSRFAYLNGRPGPETTTASSTVADARLLTLGALARSGYGDYCQGGVLLGLVWNRALSDAEIKSLSANPWAIFEPEVQRVWVDDYVSAGGGATVIPIGVQATGSVGTPSATGAATTTPAGVSASSAVGTPVAVGGASIPATVLPAGVQATSAIGAVSATGAAVSQPLGVVALSAVGTPVAIAGTSIPATVLPAGVQASGAVGTPAAQGAAIAQPLGVAATAYVGTPTIATGVSGVAVAYPSGVATIGQVGTLIATGAAWTAAVGVQAVSSVGTPTAYAGEIVIYVAGAQTRPSRLQSSSRPSRLQTGTRASR